MPLTTSQILEMIVAGAMVALVAVMLFVALGAFGIGGPFFWLILIVIIVVGILQYTPGNLRALNYLSLIVMVFSYLALGPFSGYVVDAKDQIAAPIKAAEIQGQQALRDVWLLVTNPTQYYAEQQLRSARPERAISFPKALEFISADLVPAGVVPAGQEFSLFAVMQNEADQDARSVSVLAECTESAPRNIPPCQLSANSGGMQKTATGSVYQTSAIRPGAAERYEWRFKAVGRINQSQARAGETVFNKIYLNASYLQDTSSSLQVETATREEVTRRQIERTGKFFYQQVATAKVSLAQLALNVGPQPLLDKTSEGTANKATLIVSVSNTRPDGFVELLPVGSASPTRITVKMSPVVGSGIVCQDNDVFHCTSQDAQTVACEVKTGSLVRLTPQTTQIIAGAGQLQAITAAVFCNFNVAEVSPQAGSLTGLVNAEIKDYMFTASQQKSVAVAAPLGVLIPQIPGG